jgi:RNA polymerase sigma-70 factor (ECF subfamily)
MDDGPATRHTLLVKLRDPGDAAAWAEFVALYQPLLYRLARTQGLQPADADDLCQDVFRAVGRTVEGWEPDLARGRFRGWLFTVARNLALNTLTRGKRHRGAGDTAAHAALNQVPAADPALTAEFDAEYRRRLFRWAADQVRDEFTPATWQAFWATAVEGRPPAAVAADLGLSVGAVYVAKSRVLARLRKRIEQLGDDTADRIVGEV